MNEGTRKRLCKAIDEGHLPAFAKNHALSIDHFLLQQWNDRTTPLHKLAFAGQMDQLAAVLKEAKEPLLIGHVLAKSIMDMTPLHSAAWTGHLDQMASVLKEFGQQLTLANLLTPDKGGSTPLHEAVSRGHIGQAFSILQKTGETLSADHLLLEEEHGDTPLSLAASAGHLATVFQPSLWVGRPQEMSRLWSHVPLPKQGQAPFEQLLHETLLLSRRPIALLAPEAFRTARRTELEPPEQKTPPAQGRTP
ncbi:MAG: hypothetical protein PW734_00615 [Verrucomicrobium sp.]|nr:hypothetical protein [Verrucomicrobium sp.]